METDEEAANKNVFWILKNTRQREREHDLLDAWGTKQNKIV